ncbi:MAG: CpaF family protein [Methanobacteriota archaeon]|nr:MAG: CpaF family protein [Euryarchaeota archaeon]
MKTLEIYSFQSEDIPVQVKVMRGDKDFVPTYEVKVPGIGLGTKAIIETKLRAELLSKVDVDLSELLDPKKAKEIQERFFGAAREILAESFKEELSEDKLNMLATYLIQHTIGLGDLDILLSDNLLEEVVINGPGENIWVYHKKYGWCITNLKTKDDEEIYNYSSLIARKIGRQINVLNPLLDAHIYTGDRVNATLFPISSFGNTLTIRKFSRNPWTITNLIASETVSSEVMALIWLAMQNELSLLVSGGTGSGKTSFLNAIAGFIPANQRVISIEDTRELTLPKYLQWVPMVTREPNPEGKGEITMLDLLVNSLRMRPDRILVGEIRRQKEAEVMFEAMHTGHSVYATLHADNAEQTITRLTTPPINLPEEVLDALAGIVVQFRHRRYNIRRTLEFAEVYKKGELNTLYRWESKNDKLKRVGSIDRMLSLINLYTGMTEKEIASDIEEKAFILDWMVSKKYFGIDQVGHIVSTYYNFPDEVLKAAENNKRWVFG